MIITVINSFLVFTVAAFFAFYLARNKTEVPLVSWSMLAISIVYGLGSIIVLISVFYGETYYGSSFILNAIDYWPVHGLLVLVLIVGIVFGWRLPIVETRFIDSVINKTIKLSNKNTLILAFFMLFLGVVLRWLYVKSFGGFLGYLDYNRAIRSGIFEINNPYSFLQPFSFLPIFSSYFFFSLYVNRYSRFIVIFGFVLSFLFSLYIYFSLAGRVGFILYLASFLLAFLYIKSVRPKIILSLSFLGFPLIVLFLYFISNYFSIKGSDSVSYYFIKEIGFVYTSFFAQFLQGDLSRLFIDFFVAPIHLLPSSWTGGFYETASQANTVIIMGAKKGEQGVTGGIPVDLLTLGIMQLNILGVLPVGVLFGLIIKRLDYLISLIDNKGVKVIILSYVSLRIAFIGLLYSQPPHFVMGLFPLLMLGLMLYFFNFVTRTKFKK